MCIEADLKYAGQKMYTFGCPAAHRARIHNAGLSFHKHKLYARITKHYDRNWERVSLKDKCRFGTCWFAINAKCPIALSICKSLPIPQIMKLTVLFFSWEKEYKAGYTKSHQFPDLCLRRNHRDGNSIPCFTVRQHLASLISCTFPNSLTKKESLPRMENKKTCTGIFLVLTAVLSQRTKHDD